MFLSCAWNLLLSFLCITSSAKNLVINYVEVTESLVLLVYFWYRWHILLVPVAVYFPNFNRFPKQLSPMVTLVLLLFTATAFRSRTRSSSGLSGQCQQGSMWFDSLILMMTTWSVFVSFIFSLSVNKHLIVDS